MEGQNKTMALRFNYYRNTIYSYVKLRYGGVA